MTETVGIAPYNQDHDIGDCLFNTPSPIEKYAVSMNQVISSNGNLGSNPTQQPLLAEQALSIQKQSAGKAPELGFIYFDCYKLSVNSEILKQ